MEQIILKTKLYVPTLRDKLVFRPRLLERFRTGLKQQITLVVAPAGYGKTTLLCQGLQGSSMPIGWVTLDEDDNDPIRFWSYVISAMQTARAKIGKSSLIMPQSPQESSIKSIITSVINEIIETNEEFILVLDDYHVIQSNNIHSTLAFFLEHIPSQIHLVIASRSYPELPLARLRVRGSMSELYADDLKFTVPETTAFFNDILETGISDDDIAVLDFHIEGWVAGLQMAAISMQGREDISNYIANFNNNSRYIMDYLVEEVLLKQKESIISFLLDTAILNRFTVSLCNAVTGRDDGQKMLELLESGNLFLVPLDNEHKWYRYHHLFADLLCKKLLQTQRIDISELHVRASKWFEQKELMTEAIHHALIAQDYDRAASLIERAAKLAMCTGRIITILKWLDELPQECFSKWPRLCIYHAWVVFIKGNISLAEKILRNTREIIQALPNSSDNVLLDELAVLSMIARHYYGISEATQEANEVLTRLPDSKFISRAGVTVALGHASEFSGNMEKSLQLYEKAKDLAVSGGYDFLVATIEGYIATAMIRQGRLTQAVKYFNRIVKLGERQEVQQFPPAGIGYIGLAGISLERNDLEASEHYIDKGIELCQLLGLSKYLIPAYYTKARLDLARGDRKSAMNRLHQIEKFYFGEVPPIIAFQMVEYQTRLSLLLNDLESALYWVKSFPEIIRNEIPGKIIPPVQYEMQQILLSKLHIAMGEYEEAIGICDRIRASVEANAHMARIIDIGLIEAIAVQSQGDVAKALNILEYTLSLAEPEDYIRTFIDEGESMQILLQEAASRCIQPKYVNRLLAAFRAHTSQLPYSPVLPKQLSNREIEILQLIASGMPNRVIAKALVLSDSTIKTHINNLYRKLDVQSRTQVIVRAKELNLLS